MTDGWWGGLWWILFRRSHCGSSSLSSLSQPRSSSCYSSTLTSSPTTKTRENSLSAVERSGEEYRYRYICSFVSITSYLSLKLSQGVAADCPEDLGVSAWRARVRVPDRLWAESQADLPAVSLQLLQPEGRGGQQHSAPGGAGRRGWGGAGGLGELSPPAREPGESADSATKPLSSFLHWLPYSVSTASMSWPESVSLQWDWTNLLYCRVSKDSSSLPPTYSSLNLSENISDSPPPPPHYEEALKIGF